LYGGRRKKLDSDKEKQKQKQRKKHVSNKTVLELTESEKGEVCQLHSM